MDNERHVQRANSCHKDTHTVPEISVAGVGSGPFLIKCIDLDAPFKSYPFMSPILHWAQDNLKPDASGKLSASGTPFLVDHVGAGPPPFAKPHRYVFMLYEQPEGFDRAKFASPDGQKVGMRPRMRYDYEKFVKEAELGRLVAATWFESN